MMKSRTLIEVAQLPGRKPCQQSPESTSFLRAALAFMVRLPAVHDRLPGCPRSIRSCRDWYADHWIVGPATFDLCQAMHAVCQLDFGVGAICATSFSQRHLSIGTMALRAIVRER